MIKTWREMINKEMEYRSDSWDKVEAVCLPAGEWIPGDDVLLQGALDVPFDAGFGTAEGDPFALWTGDWVYFPVDYDGAETVCSIARGARRISLHTRTHQTS